MDLHAALEALSDAHRGKSLRFLFELTCREGVPADVAALEGERLPGAPIDRDVVRLLGDLFGSKSSPKWPCNFDVRLLRRSDPRSNRALNTSEARVLGNVHSALSQPRASMLTSASADELVVALDQLVSGQVPGHPRQAGFGGWAFDPASLHVCKVPTGTKAADARAALALVLLAVFEDA